MQHLIRKNAQTQTFCIEFQSGIVYIPSEVHLKLELFFKLFLKIEMQLTYSVVVISVVQQYICINIYSFSFSFPS